MVKFLNDCFKQSYKPDRCLAFTIVSIELNIVSWESTIVAEPLSIVS